MTAILYQNYSHFLVRTTGLVARETSVIAIATPMCQSRHLHVCRLQTSFADNCKLSQVRCRNKKKTTKSSFVGADNRTCRERNERNSDCCAVCANRVSCTCAGCKHRLPTIEKLSQVRCRNKKKTNEVVFFWCGQQDLNLHLLNENKNLNLARLPIPPCPHYVAILDYTSIYVNSMCPKSNIILRDTKIDLHKRLILAKILI